MNFWLYGERATLEQVTQALRTKCGLVEGDSTESPMVLHLEWQRHASWSSLRATEQDVGLERGSEVASQLSLETKSGAGWFEAADAHHASWSHAVDGTEVFTVSPHSSGAELPEAWRAPGVWQPAWADEALSSARMESLLAEKLGAVVETRPLVFHRQFTRASLPALSATLRTTKSLELGPLQLHRGRLSVASDWRPWLDGTATPEMAEDKPFHVPKGHDAKRLEGDVRALLTRLSALDLELLVLDDLAVFEKRIFPGYQGRNPRTGEVVEVPAKVVFFARLATP